MTWNYRIVKSVDRTSESGFTYKIHEVYYDDEEYPYSMTEEAVAPAGNSVEDLKDEYLLMNEAFDKPVLLDEDFQLVKPGMRARA